MIPTLPADLPQRPAAEGARLVALALLDQAADAVTRLGDRDDAEALHDFRVALRRLRSTLRAFRDVSGDTVSKKQRRRLRDLADRTNAGRDAEVQLAWLRDQAGRLSPRERPGLHWLIDRLEQRLEHEYSDTVADVRAAFPRLHRKLRRRLGEYSVQLPAADAPPPPRFGAAARAAIETAAADLGEALAEIAGPADAAAAHRARIAAKRTRYLLEPFAERVPGGPDALRRLKVLQDLLGEFNDCQVLEAEIAESAAELGANRARRLHEMGLAAGPDAARRAARSGRDGRAGLMALGRLVRARRDGLFATLEMEWLGDHGAGFIARLEGAAAALDATGPGLSPRPRPRPPAWRRGVRPGDASNGS